MLFAKHIARLFASVLGYSVTTRRVGMLLVVLIGAVAVTIAAASSAVVPLVVYPFA